MRPRTWFIRPQINADERRFRTSVLSASICVYLWLTLFPLSAAPRWNIQFLYDHADSNFAIEDLQCPTPRHCVAGGWIDDKKGHEQGAVLVSTDGGSHWSQYEVKERPVSLFFLNESLGWMVTDRGLWSTNEGGRSWIKVQSRKGVLQTWFLDPNHGFIAGLKGLVEQTSDGGKTWAALEFSGKAPEAQLNYDIITFQGTHGLIVGAADPAAPVLSNLTPESAPRLKVTLLETLDGKKWTPGIITLDGELAQLRLSSQGFVVSLLLYSDPKYPVGSAVFETLLSRPEGRVIFAERDRAATDIALLSDGSAVLATIEPPGNSTLAPIPGKLKMLKSADLKVWREMDVDYRVVAQRAIIAAPDAHDIWVATDTGAILKLVE
ncbi:MAG: WD40/YVTN/BNR-like repeat-containing protein [Bryobacteraceae bacterium]